MSIQARTLLVDDELAIEQALANKKNLAPALIVNDVLVPMIDGRDLFRSLSRDDNWILIILLTQVGEAFERVVALGEGVDEVITKPFEPYEMVARIRVVRRWARPRNHHYQQLVRYVWRFEVRPLLSPAEAPWRVAAPGSLNWGRMDTAYLGTVI